MPEHAHGMRPLTDLLSAADALRRILEACQPVLDTESLALVDAVGRILAEDLSAAFDVPPFDRAAMDGYALRSADAAAPNARLRVAGNIHAGASDGSELKAGECVQIATGAPLPAGADAVVPVERTRLDHDHVVLERPVGIRENVSLRGSDVSAGTRVLTAGLLLTPARLAVAAALGRDRLRAWRRPRVTVLSTGSELQPPGAHLRPGEIYDSNGPALAALFAASGAQVTEARRVADDLLSLRGSLRQGAGASDLVVASGASSAGEKDLLRDAVRAEGSVDFHGVRVKPGKPLLLGRIGTTPVVGLPGYPTSCLSDAYLFVLPALRRLAHAPEEPQRRFQGRLGMRVASVPGRDWFMPVRLEAGLVVPTYKESGATTSLSDAVGYVVVKPETPFLEQGDVVDVVLF